MELLTSIDDRDDVHEWLHQIALHYRGLVDQGRDNGPSDRLHARLTVIHALHAERQPECPRFPVPGTLAHADAVRANHG